MIERMYRFSIMIVIEKIGGDISIERINEAINNCLHSYRLGNFWTEIRENKIYFNLLLEYEGKTYEITKGKILAAFIQGRGYECKTYIPLEE